MTLLRISFGFDDGSYPVSGLNILHLLIYVRYAITKNKHRDSLSEKSYE